MMLSLKAPLKARQDIQQSCQDETSVKKWLLYQQVNQPIGNDIHLKSIVTLANLASKWSDKEYDHRAAGETFIAFISLHAP